MQISKILSIVIAILTAASVAYTQINGLIANPTVNALAIAGAVWILITTITHVLSDYLPAWFLALVTDIDGFLTQVHIDRVVAKATSKISTIAILLVAVFSVGCGATPCGSLENSIQAAQDGVVAAKVVCPCLSFNAEAEAICEAAAQGLTIAVDAAKEVDAEFCASADAGETGAKASSKLRTKDEFDAWFATHGAKKATK